MDPHHSIQLTSKNNLQLRKPWRLRSLKPLILKNVNSHVFWIRSQNHRLELNEDLLLMNRWGSTTMIRGNCWCFALVKNVCLELAAGSQSLMFFDDL